MAKLIYAALTSLDGYVSDSDGSFDWAAPDEDVHRFVNDLERPIGTHLFGRKMYDTLAVWETMDVADEPEVIQDYQAIWKASDKVVYSRSLEEVRSARTQIEREFRPDAVRQLKAGAGQDLSIGGAELAAQALKAGLVDELLLILSPVVVGSGHPALPEGVRLDLELLAEHRFTGGTVALQYAVRG